MTFVRAKGNYVRLIVMFLLIYGMLPLTILISGDTLPELSPQYPH